MVISDEKKMSVGSTLIAIVNFSDAKSPKTNSVPCAVNPNKASTKSFSTENNRSPTSVFITRTPNDTCNPMPHPITRHGTRSRCLESSQAIPTIANSPTSETNRCQNGTASNSLNIARILTLSKRGQSPFSKG